MVRDCRHSSCVGVADNSTSFIHIRRWFAWCKRTNNNNNLTREEVEEKKKKQSRPDKNRHARQLRVVCRIDARKERICD